MKKYIGLLFLAAIGIAGCNSAKTTVEETSHKDITHYLSEISKQNLINHVTTLAADDMEGRETGEPGQKKAAQYIRDFYKKEKITAAKGTSDYFQMVPSEAMRSSFGPVLKDSENVVAFIEGTEFPNEYLVISAHYDHVGMDNDEVYNGADDNASGTAGIMEIARVFQTAKNEGNGPKRSIIILNCTGEEYGLHGSRYYTDHPLYPLNNTIANLNVDMIGRIDDEHTNHPNYIYLVGSDRLSNELHQVSESANEKYVQLTLDYKFNAPNHPEMIYYRSDHYNFAKNNIPVIFYYNGPHADYHQPTDTVEKIAFDEMTNRVKLIFATAWELANRKERIKLNNQ